MPTLGSYRVVRPLGEGGQATVWEGLGADGTRVALKRLHPERLLRPGARERFAREATVLRALAHPGLLRLLDAGEEAGVPFLVYELLEEAAPLDEAFQGRTLLERVELVRDAARAVGALHWNGVVHRDLTPGNVLVDRTGRVRVADLGLARDDGLIAAALTRTGEVLGTPGWIAPEVGLQGSHDAGPTADVWSLGLILHLALTGRHPFAGCSFPEMLDRLRGAGPPSARRREPAVTPELDQVCLKALAPRPEERWPEAGALAGALDEALEAARSGSASSSGRLSGSGRLGPGQLEPGVVLEGRWRILGRLGKGGMGAVYRARDQELDRDVAIKLPHASVNPAQLQRFLREVELTASARHRNLVRVHGGGVTAEGWPFLVLELIESGVPLEEAMADRPLEERVGLVVQVAQAVAALHERGIVHRDLKPENVLVDADGIARLVDLGLARGEGQEQLTRSGTALGSPLYMAPEQVQTSRDRPIDARADVFALGVLLYRALTGRHPFPHEGRSLVEIMAMLLECPPLPIRGAPPALEAVCLRALAKDPAGRQADAAELARDVTRALEPGRPLFTTRALALAALLGLAGGAGLALTLRPGRTPAAAATAAVPSAVAAPAPSAATAAAPASAARPVWVNPANGSGLSLYDEPGAAQSEPALREMLLAAERLAEREPQVAKHQHERGRALYRLGERQAAIAAYTRALDLDPGLLEALLERSAARAYMGDVDGAMEDARRVSELAPFDPRGPVMRGIYLMHTNRPREALVEFERAVQLDRTKLDAWEGLAAARFHSGLVRESVAASSHVLEQDPNRSWSWHNRGLARWKLGELEGAVSDLTRAIALSPSGRTGPLVARARIRFDQGDLDAALTDLDGALEDAPRDAAARMARAEVRLRKRDVTGALADMDAALSEEPRLILARLQRAELRARTADLPGAIGDWEWLLENGPPYAAWRAEVQRRLEEARRRR